MGFIKRRNPLELRGVLSAQLNLKPGKEFIIDQALICDLRRLMRKKPRIDHLCKAINAIVKTTISAIRTANVILTQLFG